jgi:hypothetical protein
MGSKPKPQVFYKMSYDPDNGIYKIGELEIAEELIPTLNLLQHCGESIAHTLQQSALTIAGFNNDTHTIELSDFSDFFQEIKRISDFLEILWETNSELTE